MTEQYVGRLVSGLGKDSKVHLLAHGDGTGEVYDEDGNILLREVTWDPDTKSYIYVDSGAQTHNERFNKGIAEITGTSEPLYDKQGNLVQGDEHHFFPIETDSHFFRGASNPDTGVVNHTRLTEEDDSVSPTLTGHTEAYSGR